MVTGLYYHSNTKTKDAIFTQLHIFFLGTNTFSGSFTCNFNILEDTFIMSHTKEGIIQIVVPLCADVECNTHTSSFGSTDVALMSATVDSALEDVDQ